MACSWATPSGPRNSTKAPSRTPSPDIEIGSTWAMSTAGKNARRAVRPAGCRPRAWAAATAASTSASWYANPAARTLAAAAGWLRMRATPRWMAPMKRRHPSRVAKRPPMRVLLAATRTTTSRVRVPRARARATRVAVPRCRRPGLIAKPAMVMTGRTSHPVSRSSTTEAKVPGDSPVSRDSRLTRSTSPPMVVGSTFDTNWPAM